jgi:hypothetical protein
MFAADAQDCFCDTQRPSPRNHRPGPLPRVEREQSGSANRGDGSAARDLGCENFSHDQDPMLNKALSEYVVETMSGFCDCVGLQAEKRQSQRLANCGQDVRQDSPGSGRPGYRRARSFVSASQPMPILWQQLPSGSQGVPIGKLKI